MVLLPDAQPCSYHYCTVGCRWFRRTFADAHRRYTGYVNTRMRVTGHLWQGRFGSVVLDEEHLAHAVRYVSLNPVRAGLVEQAKDWPWSSAACHLLGGNSELVKVAPVLP